jgi:hypothetical protein
VSVDGKVRGPGGTQHRSAPQGGQRGERSRCVGALREAAGTHPPGILWEDGLMILGIIAARHRAAPSYTLCNQWEKGGTDIGVMADTNLWY